MKIYFYLVSCMIVTFSCIQMGISCPSALWVRCIPSTLQGFKILMEEWKIENFRSTHCHRASLPLVCSCWCRGGGVTVVTSAELICMEVHWLSQLTHPNLAERGRLPSAPASFSGPGTCRIPQFVVLKHFSSPCRSRRDRFAAGVLSTDSKESLFPLRAFCSRLQVLF